MRAVVYRGARVLGVRSSQGSGEFYPCVRRLGRWGQGEGYVGGVCETCWVLGDRVVYGRLRKAVGFLPRLVCLPACLPACLHTLISDGVFFFLP